MITVTNGNDAGAGSLRQALLDAAVGEVINFNPAVTAIALTGGELLISQNQTITGNGSALLTISATGSRIFHVLSGIVQITGLSISGGAEAGGMGGGIFNETTLTLNDIIVDGCTADTGGGIANNSTVLMNNVTVQNCEATVDFGGGIYNENTFIGSLPPTPANNINVFACTAALDGGGIYNTASCDLLGCTIDGNTATNTGGGIWNGGTLDIKESTVSGNSAPTNGDGIFNDFGTVSVIRCTFTGNVFNGFYAHFGTNLIQNSTFSNEGDVAIINDQGNITIQWCTVTGNQYGLLMLTTDSVVNIYNCIFCGNSVFDIDGPTNSFTSLGYNIIGVITNPIISQPGDQLGVSIADVHLGPLQNNGGPTETHALLAGSFAIDLGSSVGGPATDQRGAGFPRVIGGNQDIGAFESDIEPEPPPPEPPTPTPSDTEAIIAASQCYVCLGLTLGQAIQVVMLARWAVALNASADVSREAALARAKCYACYGPLSASDMLQLGMLVSVAAVLIPTVDISPQALNARSACFTCYGAPGMILALLGDISEAVVEDT